MKLTGAKALDFCRSPKDGVRIALLFGADQGVAADAAEALITAWRRRTPEGFDIARLAEDVVKKTPAALFDALSARSLLGGETLVRTKLDGDGAAKTMVEALDAVDAGQIGADAYWVVEAPDLPPKSKIRKAFEAATGAYALQLYADSEAQIADMARGRLEAEGAAIDADALALFTSELPGDRRMANSEIDKLCLFAIDLDRPITLTDIDQIAASEQPKGADDAADAALAGDMARADAAATRFLEAGGSPVSALRTLHFRVMRLSDAQAGAKFLRPPVFDRDRPAFNAVLRDWPPTRITRALAMLYAAEKTCKQAGAPAEAAFRTVIDRLARRKV